LEREVDKIELKHLKYKRGSLL